MKFNVALIDNDYIQKLSAVQYDNWEDLIKRFLQAINYTIKIHELVYLNEASHLGVPSSCRNRILYLTENNIITRINPLDELSESQRQYYIILFNEIKHSYNPNMEDFDDIFSYWKSNLSLGEMHSLTLCCILEYDLFLSDDNDSKRIIQIIEDRTIPNTIHVYNRKETINELIPDNEILSRKEKRMLSKEKF